MTLTSYRVLIVDDNMVFAKTLSMLIQTSLGDRLSSIEIAINGEEAVDKAFNEDGFDVIFMDVNMPQMNGIMATKIINKELFRQTRIVAVSFHKDINTVKEMIKAGAENFLYKDNLTIESIENIFN